MSTLKLYLLTRKKRVGSLSYDVMDTCVIAAEGEVEARTLATEWAGDEGKDVWLRESKSDIEELTSQNINRGLICRDFRAG